MFHRFSLVNLAAVLVVLALSAVRPLPAAVVERQALNGPAASTITVLTTVLLDGPTTSTVITKKVCGVIDADASTACRRKRQYWVDVPILIGQNAETAAYIYHQFQPSPVFGVEPTPIVQLRHSWTPSSALIDSSLDVDVGSRASGAILAPINSIRSSLLAIATSVINSFLTPVETVTSTVSEHSSTITTTIFAATETFTIAGCVPEGISFSAC